jgi:hypothetical protein
MTPNVLHKPQDQVSTYKSLGLSTLLSLIPQDRCLSVLDLGPALGVNVEFWGRYHCKLHIQNFYPGYTEKCAAAAATPKDIILSEFLSFGEEVRFDVILAWDLLNYLSTEELEALIRLLERWSRPGTMIFALISSLAQIPAVPILFRILDSDQMIYEMRTPEMRPCPRLQPRDLARMMAPFAVSHSFLLRHGIQEYIFSRQ